MKPPTFTTPTMLHLPTAGRCLLHRSRTYRAGFNIDITDAFGPSQAGVDGDNKWVFKVFFNLFDRCFEVYRMYGTVQRTVDRNLRGKVVFDFSPDQRTQTVSR